MVRLTYKEGKQCGIKGLEGVPCDEVCESRVLAGCGNCPIQNVFDRLSAYEDSGLDPEKIMEHLNQPNDALTVEELRETEVGEWLWIESSESNILNRVESAYYKVLVDYSALNALCFGYPGQKYKFYYTDYGETWLAYRRKPEEGER